MKVSFTEKYPELAEEWSERNLPLKSDMDVNIQVGDESTRVVFNGNDNRVFIEDTKSNQEYFCFCCGEVFITKKGNQRQHHFSHKPHTDCKDTWERNRTYNISDWHIVTSC